VALFCDASALVKYYVTEPGSTWVRQALDARPAVFLSEITVAEVSAALGIVQRQGRADAVTRQEFWDRFEHDVAERYSLVHVALDSIYLAAQLCIQHPLKAYDAVQLATALSVRETLSQRDIPLTFVSGDSTLVVAATTEGVMVDNPFWHTELDQ
jgi:uncharacterized protein